MLIPDARRSLFGGLIDYGALLALSPPRLTDAIAGYRRLRQGPHGWMMGRFVVPASLLEDLADLLVRTMTAGEAPWSLTVVFDGDPARDAAAAASVHALLDPAAPIDVILFPPPSDGHGDIEMVVQAAFGIHPEAFPLIGVSTDDAIPVVESSNRVAARTLRPGGLAIQHSGLASDTAALPAILTHLRERMVPFVLDAPTVPPVTDGADGLVGLINLLAAIGSNTDIDTRARMLATTDASAFRIGFDGIAWSGDGLSGHAGRSSARDPMLSVVVRNPGSLLDGVRGVGIDG